MFEFSKPAAGRLLGRFLRDESGTSAIEYAIIASGVSIAIVATIVGLGANVKSLYTTVAASLN